MTTPVPYIVESNALETVLRGPVVKSGEFQAVICLTVCVALTQYHSPDGSETT